MNEMLAHRDRPMAESRRNVVGLTEFDQKFVRKLLPNEKAAFAGAIGLWSRP